MLVRLADMGDAEAIRSIYNAEVTGGVNTFDLVPRSAEQQHDWMAGHRGAHPVVVAVETDDGGGGLVGRVVAFGSLSPFRNRPGYSTTVEDSVYVAAGSRGKGAGRAVLTELVRLATTHGFHAVMARVVGGNEVSVALHRSCGFELVGTEREVGRKHGRWLDVAELQRLL